jgi:chlorobactene glucosyltransferase
VTLSLAGWLALLPWIGLVLALPLFLRRRPRLSTFAPPLPDDAPLVSVIVPARNEAVNISICVASLLNSLYPKFEVIVVDDDSVDGTSDIVRILVEHSADRLQLVDGTPLPEGWLGKPWACWQGVQRARGELLLFTDADTRHDEMLLGHAVGALQAHRADLVSVLPRQLMGGFWERLVLPQIFALIQMRFYNLDHVNRTRRPLDVIANGQFLLIRRDAYDAIGGHEALRLESVEDQRMAQRVVEAGRRLCVAHAADLMETRMYRSLAGIIEGWSKNLATGARQSVPAVLGPLVPWLIMVFVLVAWVAPAAVLVASLFAPIAGGLQSWSLAATMLSLLFWLVMLLQMRAPPLYAAAYPIGALVTAVLFARSALRGSRLEWKGRRYDLSDAAVATVVPGRDAHGP